MYVICKSLQQKHLGCKNVAWPSKTAAADIVTKIYAITIHLYEIVRSIEDKTFFNINRKIYEVNLMSKS